MNKFFKVMLIFLTIFISILLVQFMVNYINSEETKKIEETTAQISPEELQTQTTIAITDIILNQLLENVILNIDFTHHDGQHDVDLFLQGREFVSEDTLLKDSYNILKEINKNETIHDFTLKWYMPVKNKNTEILTLSFSQDTISKIKNLSYKQLKQVATHYEKHEALY
ncbi:hypothetical protein [Solibacillus sp. FSL K6-1523]|uniref:hypothetical protein n=1 Tax=Solibacillus sp. FSL K6-1523 TaxID=2921471 RepID=UPI0030F799EB